jgi:2-polyprenyl-6-methoxyphenol hydroxylase-like FAD-dependent oxidoreductase
MAAAQPHPVDTQVLVVGAGPVGLMLAAELGLGGARVTVLETLRAPTTESRATTLHARTMEILDSRGLLAALGTVPGERRGHFAGLPLDLTLPGPWPGLWKVPQARTEELLQGRAGALGARVLRGRTVVGIEVYGDRVEAEVAGPGGRSRLTASYLVGCDGEASAVRRLTGADFPGTPPRRLLLRADVTGVDVPDRRFERREHGLAICARRPDGVTRVMVHEFTGPDAAPLAGPDAADGTALPEPDFGQVVAAWRRVTGEDLSHGTPLWVNAFHDGSRLLTRYRHGRVLLAGDAAHQQMPIGGQALNLGLQDAFNLGWKLALAVRAPGGGRPEAYDALLETYHDERHAVGARVLANIRAQAGLLMGGPEVDPVRALLTELLTTPGARRTLAGMISGLDIRYPGGRGEHELLGARCPHTELVTAQGAVTTTALLRAGRAVLLDLSGTAPSPLGRVAAPWRDRVDVVAAVPAAPGPLRPGDRMLLRPDGHIAWAGQSRAAAACLPDALEQWAGPPDTTAAARPPVSSGRTA